MSLPNHGANPNQLAEALGVELPESYIDFSENTNPFGPPNSLKNDFQKVMIDTVSAYPDPHVTQLTKQLAHKNKIQDNQIIIGNGAAELIFLIASSYRGKRVRIVEPAFSEYFDACAAYNCDINSYVLEEPWELKDNDIQTLVKDVDLLFLCSPNNPTGVRYDEEVVRLLLDEAEKNNVTVVIDEAFYDFCENEVGLERLLHLYPHLIILRSMTKMYAIAGLRLGYVLASKKVITSLKALQPPWSVNGIAQKIGLSLLEEESFVQNSVNVLHTERKRMKEELEKLSFHVSTSTVNYYLLSEQNKEDLKNLFLYLVSQGIVPRHTYNFKGLDGKYLRFAVKDRKSNDMLLQALSKWRSL